MKAVAINSSPNMGKGNTALVLDPFLEGMREAGAEVELYYTKKLTINPCQGEASCWRKKPGKCIHHDDMEMLNPKLADADVWVLATPLYIDGVSASMKNLLERVIPLWQGSIELRDGHCRHPRREGTRLGRLVLVSTCGFWELDNFDPLIEHFKAICRTLGCEFSGALLRPCGQVLRAMRGGILGTVTRARLGISGVQVNDIIEAAKDAGRQLATQGKMFRETLQIVSREVIPLNKLLQLYQTGDSPEVAITKTFGVSSPGE